ncbi:MAG: membrane protein insertase YidC [Marinilabiliaceae bacterium]|nr:membrane protein insertase YidC [Marinilabiliaceae bacterium]
MDRNSILGIVLIVGILVFFGWFNMPSKEEVARLQAQRDSIAKVEMEQVARAEAERLARESQKSLVDTLVTDSVAQQQHQAQYGVFGVAAQGENQFITLENQRIKVVLSTLGGRIYSVELKDYTTFDGRPVVLFDGQDNHFGFTFTYNNRVINTAEMFFEPVKSDSANQVQLRLNAGEGRFIAFAYRLPDDAYMVDFSMASQGLTDVLGKSQSSVELLWEQKMPQQEKGRDFEIRNSGVYYKFFQDEVDWLSVSGNQEEDLRTPLTWVGFKDQFFSSVFIAKDPFLNGNLKTNVLEDVNSPHIRHNVASLTVPFAMGENVTKDFNFYFGPNHFYTLQKQGKELELKGLIHLGWGILGWINRGAVIPVFNWLESYISNYGIIILILTILIKLVLFPLTYKSYMSTAKMKVLKPQIEEINERIPKEKAMERQQAMMGLYKKAGVNPMGGCLPMLLQFPILIAMFNFFPASIELRQEAFLWAEDLSTFDSIFTLPFTIPFYGNHVSLFCLLMAATNLFYTHINQEMTASSQSMPGMKTMMYLMPVMFLFFFNNYAAGLSYYYFISTLITIGQTYLIRRFVDEKALLAQIHANQKKPVQKSRFQQRLEDMAKQQQLRGKRK